MAKVKFSALISEMRGKLNGSVFTKNKAGNALRTKITCINRRTSAQMAIRNAFGAAARIWKTLTEAQVSAWNALSAQLSRTNIFGDKVFNAGINLFIELNNNLANAGQAAITSVPANLDCDNVTLDSVNIDSAAGGTFTFTADVAAVPAGHAAVLMVTPQLSPGRNNINGQYRKLKVIAAAGDLAAADIKADYVAKYGTLVAGNTVGVAIFLVNITNGKNSKPMGAAGSDLASKVK